MLNASSPTARPPRTSGWFVYGALAALGVVASFSHPAGLLVALPLGAYALHLFRGGRDVIRQSRGGGGRSIAWVYYGFIALACGAAAPVQPAALLGAAIAGLYSIYLFRGGRWVIWIW